MLDALPTILIAAADDSAREMLQLSANSRVVVFGSEGATDPETYSDITGHRPEVLV